MENVNIFLMFCIFPFSSVSIRLNVFEIDKRNVTKQSFKMIPGNLLKLQFGDRHWEGVHVNSIWNTAGEKKRDGECDSFMDMVYLEVLFKFNFVFFLFHSLDLNHITCMYVCLFLFQNSCFFSTLFHSLFFFAPVTCHIHTRRTTVK